MRHEKKIEPQSFELILGGKKTFELRLADRACVESDVLILRERDPQTKSYTGRMIEKTVTHVDYTKDKQFYTPEEVEKFGYQIIAFRE